MKKQVLMSALPSPDAPLVNILQALGDEFTELGRFADHLQTVLSPAMLRLADDPECHRNVQMLDLLSQRLTALSAFATSLARTVPPTWRSDSDEAFEAVTLSDLAWRLQGVQTSEEHHQAGHLELF
jgi:hypothetical protein